MRRLLRSLGGILIALTSTTLDPSLGAQQLLQNPDLQQGLTGWTVESDPISTPAILAPARLNGTLVPALQMPSNAYGHQLASVLTAEQQVGSTLPAGLYVIRAICRWDMPLPLPTPSAAAYVSIFQPSFFEVLHGDTVAHQSGQSTDTSLTDGTRLGTVFRFDHPTQYTARFIAQTFHADQGRLQLGAFRFERTEGLAIYPRGSATDPTLHLVIYAEPGAFQYAEFFFDRQQLSAPISVPGLNGAFGLVNPQPLFSQPIPPEGGRIDRSFAVPPDPSLFDRDLFIQGVGVSAGGVSLSNTIDVSFR